MPMGVTSLSRRAEAIDVSFLRVESSFDWIGAAGMAHTTPGLSKNPPSVDVAVLSHAHYDHADGMPAFFEMNDRAQLYLSDACAENCWSTKGGMTSPHYTASRPIHTCTALQRTSEMLMRPIALAKVRLPAMPMRTMSTTAVHARAATARVQSPDTPRRLPG